jgi:hypothetical protein
MVYDFFLPLNRCQATVASHIVIITYKKAPVKSPFNGHISSMTKLTKICAFVIAVFASLPFLLGVATVMVPISATAQEVAKNSAPIVCDDRMTIVSSLSDDYKETRNSIGLANSGSVVEVFTSNNGSWSMIVTRPDGISCLIAVGRNWESLTRKVGQRI